MTPSLRQTVAIFGATGAQGAPVAREALAKGLSVRAVARDIARINELHPAAEAFAAVLSDEDTVASALNGVDAAFLHLPMPQGPDDAQTWLQSFLSAAHRASLPLLVYTTSGPAGARYVPSPVIDGKTAGMDAIRKSGIPTIVLQPALYLENLLPEVFLPTLRTEGTLDYPPLPPTLKVQWTSHHDHARLAAAALTRADLAGTAHEIGTPGAVTGPALAALVSDWLGKEARYAPQTPAGFGQRVADAIGQPGAAFALADLYGSLAKLDADGMAIDTAALEKTFGVSLTPLADHIRGWPRS